MNSLNSLIFICLFYGSFALNAQEFAATDSFDCPEGFFYSSVTSASDDGAMLMLMPNEQNKKAPQYKFQWVNSDCKPVYQIDVTLNKCKNWVYSGQSNGQAIEVSSNAMGKKFEFYISDLTEQKTQVLNIETDGLTRIIRVFYLEGQVYTFANIQGISKLLKSDMSSGKTVEVSFSEEGYKDKFMFLKDVHLNEDLEITAFIEAKGKSGVRDFLGYKVNASGNTEPLFLFPDVRVWNINGHKNKNGGYQFIGMKYQKDEKYLGAIYCISLAQDGSSKLMERTFLDMPGILETSYTSSTYLNHELIQTDNGVLFVSEAYHKEKEITTTTYSDGTSDTKWKVTGYTTSHGVYFQITEEGEIEQRGHFPIEGFSDVPKVGYSFYPLMNADDLVLVKIKSGEFESLTIKLDVQTKGNWEVGNPSFNQKNKVMPGLDNGLLYIIDSNENTKVEMKKLKY